MRPRRRSRLVRPQRRPGLSRYGGRRPRTGRRCAPRPRRCTLSFRSPIAATAAEERAVARSAATSSCPAQILKNGKLVTLKTTTYRYKFVKIKKGKNKGKFRRTIVRVSISVKVSCSKQCVAVVKKRGKYQPVYSIKTVKVKAKKRNRIVTVKKRKRVYRFVDCSTLPSAEELGTPVSVTILPGSFALLDFGAFQRQAAVTGKLQGFVPGKIQLRSDIQATLNRGSLSIAPDTGLHRRRLRRPGVARRSGPATRRP